MFFTYLWRELRRRMRQALLIAFGLAVGVGLVITVTAASSGVSNAQGTVLHSLYGIGTDVTVTTAAARGSGGGSSFSVGGGLPAAGSKFSRDVLLSGSSGLGTLDSSSVGAIERLPHVSAAAGAAGLTDLDVSGTMPGLRPGSRSGGTSITTTSFTVLGTEVTPARVGPLSSSRLTAGRTFRAADARANVAVVDADYAAQNKLKPGSTVTIGGSNGKGTSFTVIGVVQAPPGAAAPADVYLPLARAQALGAAPGGGGSLKDKVNTIYVAASSAAQIAAVKREINHLLPRATATTSSDLASQVTGSLASTASLANEFGRWLAVAVLAAAFLLAGLLTAAAVARRVREFGTLKALGWRSARIAGQVAGESIVTGIIGGALGVGLGLGGAALVAALAPPLTARVAPPGGPASPGGGFRILKSLSQDAVHTVSVHLTTPVTASAIGLAVVLAIAGGVLSGLLGGWRAARLRPAAALTRVE
jgi:putative ABC transport system permease protein